MADKQDYYEILGISRDADQNAVKRAYRRLARKHHPDVSSDPEAETRFKQINEAYQVLSDPDKREVYDNYGHQGLEGGANGQGYGGGMGDFGGFGDIFDMFFGGAQTTRTTGGRPSAERGNDLRYDLEMTLEEAAHGFSKEIRYTRMEQCDTCKGSGAEPGTHPETCSVCHGSGQVRQQQQSFFGTQIRITTCPKCHGEGRTVGSPCHACSGQGRMRKTVDRTVDIPAGVDTGMRVRVTGQGDAGRRGGHNGDLYIITHVKKHDYFERRGSDLWCEVKIGFPTASLGGEIDVRTIDGTEQLEVSAGTQSGEVYVLRGKGLPDPTGGRQGDLNVLLRVETPTKLNDEQKDILRKFAEMRGEEIKDVQGKSFFERVKDAIHGL